MKDYLTVLSIILLIRCSFIICYRFGNMKFKFLQKKNSVLNNYCKVNKSNPSVYQVWGLSALWLIVYYFDFLKEIING